MKRVNWKHFGRFLAVVLAFAMLVPMVLPMGAMAAEKKEDWEKNVLRGGFLEKMVSKPEKVLTVTFLDTLDDAPEKVIYLGRGKIKNVCGWNEWENGLVHVYVAAEGGINAKHCFEMFRGCNNLEEINFNGAFHTDEATNMQGMFRNCYALKELDLSDFNTSNVTNMNAMFSGCMAIEELDLSSFDTAKVTNMGGMFAGCPELVSVDVTSFDTSRVKNMETMFRWCENLEEYDFSGWDVSKVKNHNKFMDEGMKIDGRDWEKFFK